MDGTMIGLDMFGPKFDVGIADSQVIIACTATCIATTMLQVYPGADASTWLVLAMDGTIVRPGCVWANV